MDPYEQIERALEQVETTDGVDFTFNGVSGRGVVGIPTFEAQLTNAGTTEKSDATLTVRKSQFATQPAWVARSKNLLEISGARMSGKFFVSGITDDPIAYELTLLERRS